MEPRFSIGDSIRIDIPDREDHDFEEFHDRDGEVIDVLIDSAGNETRDKRDSILYKVRFDNGQEMDFRWRDVRPLKEHLDRS